MLSAGIDHPEAPGRRERKKLATRMALHEAAATLTAQRGLAHVTVEAITDAVDVAARTFFNYYSSKEEAVLGPMTDPAELASRFHDRLADGTDLLDALRSTLVEEGVLYRTSSDALRRRMQLLRQEPTILATAMVQWELASQALTAAVAAATGLDAATHAYPSLVVQVSVAAVRTSVMRWVSDPGMDLGAIVEESFALLRAGLPLPRPILPAASSPPQCGTSLHH